MRCCGDVSGVHFNFLCRTALTLMIKMSQIRIKQMMDSGIHPVIYAKKVINAVLCRLVEEANPKVR